MADELSKEEAERRAREVAQRMLTTPKPKKTISAASEKAPRTKPDRRLPLAQLSAKRPR